MMEFEIGNKALGLESVSLGDEAISKMYTQRKVGDWPEVKSKDGTRGFFELGRW
jgi:hypothetical protein